ncbi:MAG: four helix bundle protein [Prevotellaceae bacterium]|jgi:four helix bundle protein|nr:four helix bundle protein [Prevotellaceae bacterium]
MYIYSFEKLEVWQLARRLVKVIYELTAFFSTEEKYGLSSQLRRASVSVLSDIAEGASRSSLKEQCYYLERAYGSLMEIYSQLCIAMDLSYITQEKSDTVNLLIRELSNKLNSLRNTFRKKIIQQQ